MNDAALRSLLVGSGGFIGANLRYWLGAFALARNPALAPWMTAAINVTGSLGIGICIGLFLKGGITDNARLFLAVGVLGGFTTFSAFSIEAVDFLKHGSFVIAAGYVLSSVLLAILGAGIGLYLGR